MKKLLTIVDMQNDFIWKGWALPIKGAPDLIVPMQNFLTEHGPWFDKALATMDTHDEKTYTQSPESKMFDIHCVKGTPGWELALQPKIPFVTHEKGVFDMWKNPPALDGIKPANWNVFVMGIAADFCVKYAVEGFLERGYNTTVIHDLTKGINREFIDVANTDLAQFMKTKQLRLITAAGFANARKKR